MNRRISILTFAIIIISGMATIFSSCKKEDEVEKTLAIGDEYAGGIIFYLDNDDGGLVCAKTDQNGGNGIQWSEAPHDNLTGATGIAVGTGQANTNKIVANEGTSVNYAARICVELDLEGYTDWFLPSKEELNLMYGNLHKATPSIGNFQVEFYWNSTENDEGDAWLQEFNNEGGQYYNAKGSEFKVRAVRTFIKEQ